MGYDWGDRPRPPLVGDERATLDGWLNFHRATLLWKCEGLTDQQLRTAAVPTSPLTLLGLVRHLTDVERGWFLGFLGEDPPPLYATEQDPDAEFDLTDANLAMDMARYGSEIDEINDKLVGHHLDETAVDDGEVVSLRWIYTHMLEEYARHNGHADLIREALDGTTGD